MDNQKQKKSTSLVVLVVLLLIVTIASVILATYAWAKYTTTLPESSATAVTAKWNVNGESSDLTWSKTFTHVVASKLAPGTNGTIPVTFGINDTEVDVKYTITLVSVENKPTNLKFYTDSTKTKEATVGGDVYTGTITVGGADFEGAIYWDWPYESGNDEADTKDGEAAKTMTVKIQIEATQVQPQ